MEITDQIAIFEILLVEGKLLYVDLNLPGVDGVEVLRRYKSYPLFKSIPVVVLTASSQYSDIKKCYDLGANSYTLKTTNPDVFVEVLKAVGSYWLLTNMIPLG